MEGIILEFELKVQEIDEYFNFISTTTHLSREFDKSKTVKVSEKVSNILKANLFLLLYNLTEASFKNALEQVCIKITEEELEYRNVIPELKKLWIEKEYKNFENFTVPNGVKKSVFIMQKIDNIAQDVIKIKFYHDEKKRKNDDISGNVDAREINRINEKYGAGLNTIPDIKTESLLTVKTKRNNLAHGDETFAQCGADYTIEELAIIKRESIDYMRFILKHLEEFIQTSQYKLETAL